MTTLGIALTRTPTDVKAALSLTDDARYSVQYRGDGKAWLAAASSAPDVDTIAAKVIDDGGSAVVLTTSEPLFAWHRGRYGGVLSFDIA